MRQGNVVSLTTTINDAFGSLVSTETTGVILNDELDDFTTKAAAAVFQRTPRAHGGKLIGGPGQRIRGAGFEHRYRRPQRSHDPSRARRPA